MKRIAISIALLMTFASCQPTEVESLQDIDQLVVELGKPDLDRNQFTFRITTNRSYGCDSFLTGRLVRGKVFLAMEVFGVVPGRPGCINQTAGYLSETVRMGNQRTFRLELRYNKTSDLFELRETGGEWEINRLRNELGSAIRVLD